MARRAASIWRCVTQAGSLYKTLADVIKSAREKPGALNVGTINVG